MDPNSTEEREALRSTRMREHAQAQQLLLPPTEKIVTQASMLGVPDGEVAWRIDSIAEYLERLSQADGKRLLVTFDESGGTEHDDHIATNMVVQQLAAEQNAPLLVFGLPANNTPGILFENSHQAHDYAMQYPSQFGVDLELLDDEHAQLLSSNRFTFVSPQ